MAPPQTEEGSLSAANIRAHIGNVAAGAQVAIGDHIIQIQAAAGAVVNVAPDPVPPPRRRPAPVLERPRPFADLLDRISETAAARAAIASGATIEFHGETGLGKSCLLRGIAYLPDGHPDGVVHGSARRRDLSDLLQMLFDAFFEFAENVKLTDDQIRVHLQDLHALVLLDDVTLDRDDVDALLDAAPGCIFVLAAESRVLWGQGQARQLAGLDDDDAVALFERELGRTPAGPDLARVQRFSRMVGGNPLRILQAAAEARDGSRGLAAVLDAGGAPTLSGPERSVLSALAVLGGAAVGAEHVAAITGIPDAAAVLTALERRGLAVATAAGYVPALRLPEPDPAMAMAAVAHFADWATARQGAPAQVIADAEALQGALEVAVERGRWQEADRIARSLQAALALFGLWSGWGSVLNLGLKAARSLGDGTAQAFYLHQLGTRALGLGELAAAQTLLDQAARLQQQLGNPAGAAASHANLQRLPQPGSGSRLAGRLLGPAAGMGGVVAGGLVVTILAVTGFIVAPAATWPAFAADQVAFGSVAVGATAPRDLAVRNDSTAIAKLGSITAAGDFWVDSKCPTAPAVLPPQGSCAVTINFRPTGPGPRTGSLTMTAASGIQHTALLAGTGTAPTLAFDHDTLDFGSQPVGARVSLPLTIRNAGSGQVTVTTLRPTADFAVSGSCGTLDVARSCPVSVDFVPSSPGPRAGLLEVIDGSATIHSVALTGSGNIGALSLDTSKLDFGATSLRVPVAPRGVRISNSGHAPLSLGSISAVGDFTVDAKCPPTLNPTDACALTVGFTPAAPGPRTGAVLIPYGSGNVAVVGLAALVQVPVLEVTSGLVVDVSKNNKVTVTNKGPGALQVTSVSLLQGGFFMLTNACTAPAIPAGGTCSITVGVPVTAFCAAYSDVLEIGNNSLVNAVAVLLRITCSG